MKTLKINNYKQVYYIIWDNTDETLNVITEYLKETGRNNWDCCRNYIEETNSNTGDILCINERMGSSNMSTFFRLGEYVVDSDGVFISYTKEEFLNKYKCENI